jgi:hypothetical protein
VIVHCVRSELIIIPPVEDTFVSVELETEVFVRLLSVTVQGAVRVTPERVVLPNSDIAVELASDGA